MRKLRGINQPKKRTVQLKNDLVKPTQCKTLDSAEGQQLLKIINSEKPKDKPLPCIRKPQRLLPPVPQFDKESSFDDAISCTYSISTSLTNRKTQMETSILMEYYHLYQGTSDSKLLNHISKKTGFSKKQLNKWFWDRKQREQQLDEARSLTYPGVIFAITDTRSGKDITPTFSEMFGEHNLFTTEKVPCKLS